MIIIIKSVRARQGFRAPGLLSFLGTWKNLQILKSAIFSDNDVMSRDGIIFGHVTIFHQRPARLPKGGRHYRQKSLYFYSSLHDISLCLTKILKLGVDSQRMAEKFNS